MAKPTTTQKDKDQQKDQRSSLNTESTAGSNKEALFIRRIVMKTIVGPIPANENTLYPQKRYTPYPKMAAI